MSQKSIDSFFHARKRPATDEIKNVQNNKKMCLVSSNRTTATTATTITTKPSEIDDAAVNYYNKNDQRKNVVGVVNPIKSRVRKQIDFDEKSDVFMKTRKVTGGYHPRTHLPIELTPPEDCNSATTAVAVHNNGPNGSSCSSSRNQLQQIIGSGSPVKNKLSRGPMPKDDSTAIQLITPIEREKQSMNIFDILPELATITKTPRMFDNKDKLNKMAAAAASSVVKHKDKDYITPTKDEQLKLAQANENLKKRLNMPLDKIQLKLNKSKKLTELKESLQKLKTLEDERQKIVDKNFNLLKSISRDVRDYNDDDDDRDGINTVNDSAKIEASNARLKKFEKIYLDVLTSPVKGFITPIKGNAAASKSSASPSSSSASSLMSPKEFTPRKLFSPLKSQPISGNKSLIRKSPSLSPRKKQPAYQRYQYLIDDTTSTTTTTTDGVTKPLQLPYKYRTLLEIFKSIDSVCSMYFNRCETITFKKLKAGVQRMIRKNFTETHLAQIKHLYPDAYKFYQKKMVNPGSTTKYDYYQLIIKPNVRIPNGKMNGKIVTASVGDDVAGDVIVGNQQTPIGNDKKKKKTPKKLSATIDTVDADLIREAEKQIMHPSLIIERQNYFYNLLLELVKCEHDKFLRALTPPMHIAKDQIKRWHPQFNVDGCTDIERSELPAPPNVEQFSSAKHVLATATKNLFGTVTLAATTNIDDVDPNNNNNNTITTTNGVDSKIQEINDPQSELRKNCIASVLKGVPKSLLEKIRAKQAAQAISKMTRRPSHDQSEINLNYLPELARFIRNIFVTENKNVLELHKVILKLINSFPAELEKHKIKEIIQLLIKETSESDDVKAKAKGTKGPATTTTAATTNNWLTLHSVPKKGEFLKINKSIELGKVITELERKVQSRRSTNIINDFLQNIN